MTEKMSILTITTTVLLIQSMKSEPYYGKSTWDEANDYCKGQNDTLVKIHDLRKLKHLEPLIWSSLRGKFTPWIAYRGCINADALPSQHVCSISLNNTVGKCYQMCQNTNLTCTENRIYLGVQASTCCCFCKSPNFKMIWNSNNCNKSCDQSSLADGECGGQSYVSLYEKFLDSEREANFSGLCLVCATNGSPALQSWECDEDAFGLCVNRQGEHRIWYNTTMNSYWKHCKTRNEYITGNVDDICRRETTWTGLKKYYIGSSNQCYGIAFDIRKMRYTYLESSCTWKIPFICKKHLVQPHLSTFSAHVHPLTTEKTSISSTDTIASLSQTKENEPFSTMSPEVQRSDGSSSLSTDLPTLSTLNGPVHSSTTKKTSITTIDSIRNEPFSTLTPQFQGSDGSSSLSTGIIIAIAGALLIPAILATLFFVWRYRKRLERKNRLQKISNTEQTPTSLQIVDNDTYDNSFTAGPNTDRKQEDVVYTNCIYDVLDGTAASFEMDEMYIEKKEEDYDHLHTSRQKQSSFDVEENRYGTATHLEDSQTYSTAGQTKEVDSNLENEYSGMAPSLENLQSFENPDYDHCYHLPRPTEW